MKCDSEGNVWVTAPGGLWVYAPDGRLLGTVSIPEMAANFHWGGEDWRTLFFVLALQCTASRHCWSE